MNNFERLKQMDIDQAAEWLDKHGQFDSSPWMKWFDSTYCKKCETIRARLVDPDKENECSWCELNEDKCKFFPDQDETPEGKQIVKLWLESEVEDE